MHLIFLSGTPLLWAASSVFSYSCVQFRSKWLLCWDIPVLRVCSEYCLCNARPCVWLQSWAWNVVACGITSCSPCLLRIMLHIVLHVDLMPVICLLRRSFSSVVSVLKKFIVWCFIHSLYDNSGRLEVKPYDLPTYSSSSAMIGLLFSKENHL